MLLRARLSAVVIKTNIFDLSGKVALVTGGGHGFGREYCLAMAEFGAEIACADINKKLADETVEMIKRFGHRQIAIEADVSKQEHIEAMVNQTVAELGGIDIFFYTPGVATTPVRLHELTIEEWDRSMAINLRGVFVCMRAVLPIMLKNRRGSIILTSSVAGLVAGSEEWGLKNAAPYGAAKAAIICLTRHAAVAYAKDGIRINAIAPGGHETWPIGAPHELVKQVHERMSKFIPMGRMGQPNEIKGLAIFLASDASSYITGQTFVQDGGYTA